jgi:UDP-N-acetylmuramoyl-L-alanyl-D-glutamate--2,6-diaminopimelate ligase
MAGTATGAGNGKRLQDLGFTTDSDVTITGICLDNRTLKSGDLFAALPGTARHGAIYASAAINAGASAVLTDPAGAEIIKAAVSQIPVPLIVVETPKEALSRAAALFFAPQPETMVAVTGTNGKTSVSTFCRQIWSELELAAVNIGTTGVQGAFTYPLRHTTPDAVTLHSVMQRAAQSGVTHAAMEASSHGLDQRRLDGVDIKAAGFTNFTQDHLDYHDTFDAYFAAKARLFTDVLPVDGTAVINTDDLKLAAFCDQLTKLGTALITVGHNDAADLRILNQRFDGTGQDVRFSYAGKVYQTRLSLIGGFQAANVMMAAALVIAAGAEPSHVFDTLAHLTTVRGRMEFAAERANGATVFVDYAHTPDAIETAITAFRPHVMGRLIAVIGAGGDRDTTKRPLMGQAAAQTADVVFITDDNPRSEDPASIRAMVRAGANGPADVIEIGDRAEAILRAVSLLEPSDGLLIMGKGHETGQTIGDDVFPFDDVEQASIAAAVLEGKIS